jgi:hypothetical protein
MPAGSLINKSIDKAVSIARQQDFESQAFKEQTIILDSLKKAYKQHPTDSLQDVIADYNESHIAKEDSTYESYQKRQELLPANQRDNFFKRIYKRRKIEIKQRTNKEWSLKKEIEHYQPKLYFILMPLFAFFLMLNFRHNHRYYVEHVVFTIHFFIAFFIFQIIVQIINHYIFDNSSELFNIAVFTAVAWYVYRSLRVFYQRPRWVTIRKMVTLSILFGIAFSISYGIIYSIIYMVA